MVNSLQVKEVEAEQEVRSLEWSFDNIANLFSQPLMDLLLRAQVVHRENFHANSVQLSTLVSIKTGGCPEDCAYCPQSVRFETGVQDQNLMTTEAVVNAAKLAKENGASRFCMGAAWRGPKDRDVDRVAEMVSAVKALGLETCATLGLLKKGQAEKLREAGLDYYNHNVDTSPEQYGEIISTRTQKDRLDTLQKVRSAGLSVCCGGIVGMGESREDRVRMIELLANMNPYPESVPINNLVRVAGTPLEGSDPVDSFEFIRMIAVARITMPRAMVRLSAGRSEMSDEMQALCFMAGANSIFYGDKLLTTDNSDALADVNLFERMGIETTRDVLN